VVARLSPEDYRGLTPLIYLHINPYGRFEVDLDKRIDFGPLGKMFFNILAKFAEFESDLIRMRTREGMAIARAKGKLRGKQPKMSEKQQKEL
jgi:DNA invertase Pin-like site-specific DNA recombinase